MLPKLANFLHLSVIPSIAFDAMCHFAELVVRLHLFLLRFFIRQVYGEIDGSETGHGQAFLDLLRRVHQHDIFIEMLVICPGRSRCIGEKGVLIL